MKGIKIIGVAICLNLLLSLGSSASVMHHYIFGSDGSDPFNDSVGSADLSETGSAGSVTLATNGYAHFTGGHDTAGIAHLESDAFTDLQDPAVLKIWFRTSSVTGQLEYASIFSSDDVAGENGFQIDFSGGDPTDILRVYRNTTEITLSTLSDLSADDWHLITIWRDTVDSVGKVWLDTNDVITTDTENLELHTFRLGVNRRGKTGFSGDIADVSIYGDDSWSDSQQQDAFADGPAIPEPATLSLISLMSLTFLITSRYFRS